MDIKNKMHLISKYNISINLMKTGNDDDSKTLFTINHFMINREGGNPRNLT